MNKKMFITKIACTSGISKTTVTEVFKYAQKLLIDALQKGEEVNLSGFGKFYTRQRNQREFISFQTGEKFLAPQKLVPMLKFSKKFVEKF